MVSNSNASVLLGWKRNRALTTVVTFSFIACYLLLVVTLRTGSRVGIIADTIAVIALTGFVMSLRGTVTVTATNATICSLGRFFPARSIPLSSISGARLGQDFSLEIVTQSGEIERFGPWTRFFGKPDPEACSQAVLFIERGLQRARY